MHEIRSTLVTVCGGAVVDREINRMPAVGGGWLPAGESSHRGKRLGLHIRTVVFLLSSTYRTPPQRSSVQPDHQPWTQKRAGTAIQDPALRSKNTMHPI